MSKISFAAPRSMRWRRWKSVTGRNYQGKLRRLTNPHTEGRVCMPIERVGYDPKDPRNYEAGFKPSSTAQREEPNLFGSA
jgi:hypothetical protein